jgi:hypothetical protein
MLQLLEVRSHYLGQELLPFELGVIHLPICCFFVIFQLLMVYSCLEHTDTKGRKAATKGIFLTKDCVWITKSPTDLIY